MDEFKNPAKEIDHCDSKFYPARKQPIEFRDVTIAQEIALVGKVLFAFIVVLIIAITAVSCIALDMGIGDGFSFINHAIFGD